MPPQNPLVRAATVCQLAFVGWTVYKFQDFKARLRENGVATSRTLDTASDRTGNSQAALTIQEQIDRDRLRDKEIDRQMQEWIHNDNQIPWYVRLIRGELPAPKELNDLLEEERKSLEAYWKSTQPPTTGGQAAPKTETDPH